jgi:hypothetical protein
MDDLVADFREMMENCGIAPDDLRADMDLPEDDPINIGVPTNQIARRLFLSHTSNSGGTSTANLKNLLGIEDETKYFPIFPREEGMEQ